MKRRALIRHLTDEGCLLKRHGGRVEEDRQANAAKVAAQNESVQRALGRGELAVCFAPASPAGAPNHAGHLKESEWLA